MVAPLSPATPIASDAVSSSEACALALRARALRQAAADGRLQPVLKGRKLGVLSGESGCAEALLVRRAALELGAHVSLVRPGFDEGSDSVALIQTGRTLGRLYDVVACLALPPVLVRQLRAAAGIPVLDDECVAATGAAAPGGDAPAGDDDRRFLWQALLAASLG
jgi:ornithine carbamoyltransferase